MNSLEVNHLKVWDSQSGSRLIHDSSFRIKQGSCLALVGESGSGKSVTCRAIMRLNRAGLSQSGDIRLGGVNLSQLSEKEMKARRGKQLCLIMQNGMRAFNPSCVIGVHLKDTLFRHFGWNRAETAAAMARAMECVRLKDPAAVMNSYPHQLSGGMLQRVMIALAIVLEPDVVIADEPTTALDALAQLEVMEQLIQLRAAVGCSMLFVSHDLAAVRQIADEIAVMKDGRIVESGSAASLFSAARHDYTRSLLSASLALNEYYENLIRRGDLDLADR